MTQVVTVHTDFTDLNQMAQGLVGRVDPVKVILPGPDSVDIGEWVQFAITLQDGTPGFAGVGRCVTAVDNGEERSSHQRFDVVIDSLQFDSRGQQVFEHILMLSGYGGEGAEDDGEPQDDGEGAVDDADAEDVVAEFTGSHIEVPTEALSQVGPEYEDEDQATMVGESPVDLSAAMAFESVRDVEEDMEPATGDNAFSTPAVGSQLMAAVPAAPAAPAVSPQSNGSHGGKALFSYTNGLPFPAVPPRPPIDPSQRVSPAPRPNKS